jgi:hypothetical protein
MNQQCLLVFVVRLTTATGATAIDLGFAQKNPSAENPRRCTYLYTHYEPHNDVKAACASSSYRHPGEKGGRILIPKDANEGLAKVVTEGILVEDLLPTVAIVVGEVRYLWQRVDAVEGLLRLVDVSGCVGLTSFKGYASWSDPLPVVDRAPLSLQSHLAGSYATVGELGLTPNGFTESVAGKVWSCCTPCEASNTHGASCSGATVAISGTEVRFTTKICRLGVIRQCTWGPGTARLRRWIGWSHSNGVLRIERLVQQSSELARCTSRSLSLRVGRVICARGVVSFVFFPHQTKQLQSSKTSDINCLFLLLFVP